MKRLLGSAMAAGVAILLTVVFVSAQERREAQDPGKNKQKTEKESRETTTQPGRDQSGRGRSQSDGQLVSWLASDNEGEIALGKWAAERAQNNEVKKFAQKMADAHSEFLNKLRGIAPIASTGGAAPGTRPATSRPDEPKRTQPKSETAQTKPVEETTIQRGYLDPEGRVDLARMKQEIAKQCLETTKKELGEKSGAEFDTCYMGQQIVAHLGMTDTLKVMKNYASPELRRVIEEGEKSAHEHLDLAKSTMKQIESDGSKRPGSKSDK